MSFQLILLILYIIQLAFVIVNILTNTHSSAKTLGYLLIVIMFPFIGTLFYLSVGINYRHRTSTNVAMLAQDELDRQIRPYRKDIIDRITLFQEPVFKPYHQLARFMQNLSEEELAESSFKLLVNGEEKFPEILAVMKSAKQFIHLEYYAWENDTRGNQIKDVLLQKVKEGVKVRALYDDYASRKIKKNIIRELKEGGVEVYPKIKVKLKQLANRLNHRDHRKIIIVDGTIGFVGGINLSDRYDNSIDTGLYWRDTHVKITGAVVKSLQRHFIVSWNAIQDKKLVYNKQFFPDDQIPGSTDVLKGYGQVVAGGPIYPRSNIMLTYTRLFSCAQKQLYITNPYFIPNDTILDSLKQSAISGVDVRMMLPYRSDSFIVGAASRYYFEELIQAGVRIFLYKKGFIHAKTVVADRAVSIVGTANMDIRSFDLNFEIMPVIYSEPFGKEMEQLYLDDLKECMEVTPGIVSQVSFLSKLWYSVARLISAFL